LILENTISNSLLGNWDDEGLKNLAKQLKIVRKRQGYTQEELAAQPGLSLSQIARIETEITNPTISTLMRIARTMEVPVSDLVDFKLDRQDYSK
jgi:transcriptional regulator with XRE-family HTH domain